MGRVAVSSHQRRRNPSCKLRGMFLFPNKNLEAFGDGGTVVMNDPEFAEELLRVHGDSGAPDLSRVERTTQLYVFDQIRSFYGS